MTDIYSILRKVYYRYDGHTTYLKNRGDTPYNYGLHNAPIRRFFSEKILYLYLNIVKCCNQKIEKKYIFHGTRYIEVIKAIGFENVVILGGLSEFLYCKNNNISFVWVGCITKSFELFFHGGYLDVYIKTIEYIHNLLTEGRKNKIIFLWEDVQPVGVTLSSVFYKSNSVNCICIQHGIYEIIEKDLSIGSNSDYNFLLNSSQMKYIIGSTIENTCVIGLPCDIKRPNKADNRVYLVGSPENGAKYLYHLRCFLTLQKLLADLSVDVYYRPHPLENIGICRVFFNHIDKSPKYKIFNNARSIYIGFNSTLLYEAGEFGNLTIGLGGETDDSNDRPFGVDFELPSGDSYSGVVEIVSDFMLKNINNEPVLADKNIDFLKSSLEKCLCSFYSYNIRNENSK